MNINVRSSIFCFVLVWFWVFFPVVLSVWVFSFFFFFRCYCEGFFFVTHQFDLFQCSSACLRIEEFL